MKKFFYQIIVCLLFSLSSVAYAWNWSGVLKSKIQSDNRYSHDARVFSEVWGSVQVYDYQTWNGGIDFVSRESDEEGFDAEIFQLYLEKKISVIPSLLKGGRFQRADNLGFYSLDGFSYTVPLKNSGFDFELYAGVPRRQEDVRTVTADWLYGLETRWQQQDVWSNDRLTIDNLLVTSDFQQYADEDVSTRISVSSIVEGNVATQWLTHYELSLLVSYEIDSAQFEDILLNSAFDLTEALRVRLSYEFFQPEENINFRQKFFSRYALGRQDLLRINFDYQVTPYFRYHAGAQRAARNQGEDIGYGAFAGFKYDYVDDLSLQADIDYLELGQERSENIYLGADYSINSEMTAGLIIGLGNNKKRLYGNNQSVGAELNSKYRINNHLHLYFSGSYIWYSTIENEYLTALKLTWYLDNFQAKADR